MEELFTDDHRDHPCQPEVERSPAAGAPGEQQRFIKTEANLLRLPLFALDTKRLKTLDGIECKGRITRDGESYDFVFRATRNTATLYPGPLARAAHLAFLSKITEQGSPIQNPLSWTWRDLCRRMGIVYGGKMVQHLKNAVTSTAGLLIQSDSALYSKADTRPIRTQQDRLHLYDRVVFIGSQLPDGTTADTNYLWFSEWYLSNLNAMFTAPLDYELWRYLDERSTIASRLYEFLLLNFFSGVPVLRINYETLVQFLPVRPERYLSHARKQMDPALRLLTETNVISGAAWNATKNALAQLHLGRGDRLAPAARQNTAVLSLAGGGIADGIRVRELRNLKTPEWQIVSEFYNLWNGEQQRKPTPSELEQARALIQAHGQTKAKGIIPLAVRRMKVQWPEAKTFGAVASYLPEAVRDYEREKHRIEQEKQARLQEVQHAHDKEARLTAQQELVAQWKPVWDALAESDRDAIRSAVAARWPHIVKVPPMFERFCIQELVDRNATDTRTVSSAA